jgi:hypothetical protein
MDIESRPLPPDMFEAVVTAFAETLIHHYREKVSRRPTSPIHYGPPQGQRCRHHG